MSLKPALKTNRKLQKASVMARNTYIPSISARNATTKALRKTVRNAVVLKGSAKILGILQQYSS